MQDEQKKIMLTPDELRKKKDGSKSGGQGFRKQAIMIVAMIIVVGLAVVGYFLSDKILPTPEPTPTPPPESTAKQLLSRTSADFAKATITQRDGDTYTIHKNDSGYFIEGQPAFTVDTSKALSFATQTTTLRATKTLEANAAMAAAALKDYGLHNPSAIAVATYTDGSTATIKVGDETPTGGYVYVQVSGDPGIYIAGTYAVSSLSTPLNQLHTVPTFSLNPEAPGHILIERPGHAPIEMGEMPDMVVLGISSYKVIQPVVYDMNSETGSELFSQAMGAKVAGYAGNTDAPKEYGFDPYTCKVTVSDQTGAQMSYMIGGPRDDLTTYIIVDNTRDIYYVNNALIDFLRNITVAKYVDTFAGLVNITSVDSIKLTTPTDTYNVSIDRQPDLDENGTQKLNAGKQPQTIDTYFYDDKQVDETLFKKLYQEVIGLLADGMMDEPDFHTPGNAAYVIEYTLNKVPHAFRLEYVPFGRDYYAIRRDDATLFYIRTEKLDNLAKSLAEFKEGTYVAKKY